MGKKKETVSFRVTVPVPETMTRSQLGDHIRDELRSCYAYIVPTTELHTILREARVTLHRSNTTEIIKQLCQHFDMLASDSEAMVARRYSIEVNHRRARMWREVIRELQELEWTE